MDKFKAFLIGIWSVLASLLGILAIPVILMVSCNIIDYITGLLAAPARDEKISSYKGLKGIIKKVCMWLLVVVGFIVDNVIMFGSDSWGLTLPFKYAIACLVCVWIICNELISILENISDIGVPVPAFLKKIVACIKKKAEEKAKITDMEAGESNESKD